MNSSELDNESQPRHEAYLAHRKHLWSLCIDQRTAFDKALLTLSSSALAVSIAFYDKLAIDVGIKASLYLFVSWCFLSTALLSTVLSFLMSGLSQEKQVMLFDKYYVEQLKNEPQEKFFKSISFSLTLLGSFCFIFGIIIFLYFTYANLPRSQ